MDYKDDMSVEVLFKSYSRGMYNICLRMVGNKQDAEDILQDALFQAFRNLHKLKSPESFGAWLKRIVVNQCIRFLRTHVHFSDLELVHQPADDDEEINMYKHSMKQINAEIQNLPDGCRIVFTLYLLENYTHKQIAELLGISESTSKSQYQRARQLMQNQLKNLHHG